MFERRKRLRFALEPRETFGIGGNGFRQELEGDIALEPRIARLVDLSHAAGSEQGDDLIRPDAETRTERHAWAGRFYIANAWAIRRRSQLLPGATVGG